MKRSFYTILILCSSLQAFSQTQMIINKTSGTDSIWLSDIKSITFKTFPTSSSVSIVKDSVLYTFTIPKSSFSIHDTLTGTLTAFNQSAEVDTFGVNPGYFPWTLKNSNGQIIVQGPYLTPGIVIQVLLNPKQSTVLYQIDGTNVAPTAEAVVPGDYTLNATLGSMVFTLKLSLY